MLSIISDKVIPHQNGSSVDYWLADIRHAQDYSHFGALTSDRRFTLHGRDLSLSTTGNKLYRFGFNGMEGDDEVKGNGNSYDFGNRICDSRIAKFLSPDKYGYFDSYFTPYSFAGNSPIWALDNNGDSVWVYSEAFEAAVNFAKKSRSNQNETGNPSAPAENTAVKNKTASTINPPKRRKLKKIT